MNLILFHSDKWILMWHKFPSTKSRVLLLCHLTRQPPSASTRTVFSTFTPLNFKCFTLFRMASVQPGPTIKWHSWPLNHSRVQVVPDQAAFALKPPSPPCRLCSMVNHSATNGCCVPAEGEESFTLNITWLSRCGEKLRSGTWPK